MLYYTVCRHEVYHGYVGDYMVVLFDGRLLGYLYLRACYPRDREWNCSFIGAILANWKKDNRPEQLTFVTGANIMAILSCICWMAQMA